MNNVNPKTAAAYADITDRSAAALAAYLNPASFPLTPQHVALEAYDAAMVEINEAFDALLDLDREGVTALLIAP